VTQNSTATEKNGLFFSETALHASDPAITPATGTLYVRGACGGVRRQIENFSFGEETANKSVTLPALIVILSALTSIPAQAATFTFTTGGSNKSSSSTGKSASLAGHTLGEKLSSSKLASCKRVGREAVEMSVTHASFGKSNPFDVAVIQRHSELGSFDKLLSSCGYSDADMGNMFKGMKAENAIPVAVIANPETGEIAAVGTWAVSTSSTLKQLFEMLRTKYVLNLSYGYSKHRDGPLGIVRHETGYSLVGISHTAQVNGKPANVAALWLWNPEAVAAAYESDARTVVANLREKNPRPAEKEAPGSAKHASSDSDFLKACMDFRHRADQSMPPENRQTDAQITSMCGCMLEKTVGRGGSALERSSTINRMVALLSSADAMRTSPDVSSRQKIAEANMKCAFEAINEKERNKAK